MKQAFLYNYKEENKNLSSQSNHLINLSFEFLSQIYFN